MHKYNCYRGGNSYLGAMVTVAEAVTVARDWSETGLVATVAIVAVVAINC